MEVVLVDDGSTDRTAALMEEYRDGSPYRCRILRLRNGGVAAARKAAVAAATGRYLVFLDADDAFAEGAVTKVLSAAACGADILGWDCEVAAGGRRRRLRQADYGTPGEALAHLMAGTMKWNLWLFAVRRALVEDAGITFTPGDDMGEDMAFMLKAFGSAASVRQIHEALYRYSAPHGGSVSAAMDDGRRAQVSRNLESAAAYLAHTPHAALAAAKMPSLKLYVKRPLLMSTAAADYRTWHRWWPETNAAAAKDRDTPLRIRLLQGLAARRLWPLVWMYNILVYKIAYQFLS